MTDETTDKTSEIRERVGEDGAVGGTTDGDSDTVLTLDGGAGEEESDADSAEGDGA